MGCGGSRADTIEPRYYESWTRDTESTWLTNTDTEIGQAIANNNNQRGRADNESAPMKQCTKACQGKQCSTGCPGKGEDSRPTGQIAPGAPCRERKLVNTATQCGRPPQASNNSGGKGRPLHREESRPKARRPSCKESSTTKSSQLSSSPEECSSNGK